MEKKTRQKRIVSVKTIAWSLAGLGVAIVSTMRLVKTNSFDNYLSMVYNIGVTKEIIYA